MWIAWKANLTIRIDKKPFMLQGLQLLLEWQRKINEEMEEEENKHQMFRHKWITILNRLFVLYSSFSFVLVAEEQLLWLHQTLLSHSAIHTNPNKSLLIQFYQFIYLTILCNKEETKPLVILNCIQCKQVN